MQERPVLKYTYADNLSYATLFSIVAYVGVDFFQLPCGYLFRGFFSENSYSEALFSAEIHKNISER